MKTKEEYSLQGKASKRKGNKLENYTTKEFIKAGFDTDKVSGSGASTHRKGDVKLKAGYHNFNFDCKSYERIGIYKWWKKQKSDTHITFTPGLVLREDYGDILVVLKFEDFINICKDLEEIKANAERIPSRPAP